MESVLTPSQETRAYADANGFKIVAVGRRYKCTHVASGTVFERGGYPALLNEMRAIVGCVQDGECADAAVACVDVPTIHTTPRVGSWEDEEIVAGVILPICAYEFKRSFVEYKNTAPTPEIAVVKGVEYDATMPRKQRFISIGISFDQRAQARLPTHQLQFRYKGGGLHFDNFHSHSDALTALRQMMSNKRTRPDYVNIVPVGGA